MTSKDINVHTAKVVLIGESGVGKNSIITSFTGDKYGPDTFSTVGASFVSKEIFFQGTNNTIRFEIWDTAGQEKYRSLAKIFYKNAVAIILVYDITKRNSLTEIKEYWVNAIKENSNKNVILALAANKDDLYEQATVSDEEGQEYANTINAIFKRTSALYNVGINDLFQLIGKKYLNQKFNYKVEEQKLNMCSNMTSGDAFKPHETGIKLNTTTPTMKPNNKCYC